MATETNEGAAAPKKKLLPVVLAVVLSLLVGGAVGAFALGPRLGGEEKPLADKLVEGEAGGDGEEAAEGEGEKAGAETPLHIIENLVLNPAETEGTRFLMVTLALEVRDEAGAAKLTARDPAVRDVALRVLGIKTVPQLTDLKARDSLRVELRDSLRKLIPSAGVRRVYFPQFVIQ